MKNIKFFLALISICFVFSLNSKTIKASGPTEIWQSIDKPTTWSKANSPYLVRSEIWITAPLTIEPGVIVKFDYKKSAGLSVFNALYANGTEDNPIIFTSIKDDSIGGDSNKDGSTTSPSPGDWSWIQFMSGSKAELNYVNLSYASPTNVLMGGITIIRSAAVKIFHSTIKYCGYSGILMSNSNPTIENNVISNNAIGVFVFNDKDMQSKISNNSIIENKVGATSMESLFNPTYHLDARNNWWGDKSGPYFKHKYYGQDNLLGKGNYVSDGILFDPWLQKDPTHIRKPIIFIPGIGASINPDLMIGGVLSDKWTMFDHTYDGIIQSFKDLGYIEGKDLFIGYYDWRKNNAQSAEEYLKPIIQKALTSTGANKVNIVAHSMGNLVARSYVQNDNYTNDVDNLVMIAPPNKGSSDVYSAWEGGRIPKNWEGRFIMNAYLGYMLAKNLALSNYETIHKNIPSLKELMPVYSYIFPSNDPQNLKDYLSMNERNDFLFNLNNGVDKLNQRVKVSIVMGNNQPTVGNIPVIKDDQSSIWIDGKPEPIDPQRNDNNGDGEVLLSSSKIPNIFEKVLDYGHREIVSASEKIVAERLNEKLDQIEYAPDISNELGFWFASPVDVQITAPDGKTISEKENNIPLAKYSSESKSDGFKIVSIANPIKGEYNIKITGNGDGEYHVGSEYVEYNNNPHDSSSLQAGNIKKDQVKEYIVSFNPENKENPAGEIRLKDNIPPTIEIASPEDGKEYLNNQILPIIFSISDNVSSSDKILRNVLFDGKEVDSDQVDLSLLTLGNHSVKITAMDEAENQAEKTINFKLITSLDAVDENIDHYRKLVLIADDETKVFLKAKIAELKHIQEMLVKMNDKNNDNPKNNQMILWNKKMDELISFIQIKFENLITPSAKDRIIESLEYIKTMPE